MMMKRKALLLFLLIATALQMTQAQQNDSMAVAIDSLTYNMYKNLPEVMVSGQRPVVKAKHGMLEYDMPRLLGKLPVNNVYEAVKQLPGVVEMNDRLTLGGQGMTVIINGKVSTLSVDQLNTLLKSMPPSRIEKAEVMLAAPARYQVRGTAINLILQSETDKPASVQGELFSEWQQKHFASVTERGSLLFASRRFSVDLLYSYDHRREQFLTDKSAIHTLNDGSVHPLEINSVGELRNQDHNARLGLDYAFAKDHLLSFVYTGNWDDARNKDLSKGDEISNSVHNTNNALHNLRLDYSLPFHLKAGAEYTHYNSPGDQTLSRLLDSRKVDIFSRDGQRINKLKVYAGQELTLPHDWNINFGAYYVTSHDHSFQRYYDAVTDTLIPSSSMKSVHRERLINFYGGFSKSFGSKISTELSLAAEHYHSDVWDEWTFYPTASISYMPAPGHTFQASLSTDRSYPSFWSVQNVTAYASAYSEIVGNPTLKPSTDYDTELTYILRNKYMFTLYYDYNKDYFMQTLYQQPDRLTETYRYFNFDYRSETGMRISAPFAALDRVDGQLTLIGMYNREKCSRFWDIGFDRKKWVGMVVLNGNVTLSRKPDLRFTLYGFYQSGMLQGLYDLPQSGNIDASLRWLSPDKKFILTARCADILNTSSIWPRMTTQGQYVVNRYTACQRAFVLSLTWKFGDYKEKRRDAVDTSRFK